MFNINVDRLRRTISFRASGVIQLEELKRLFEEAKWATDLLGGEHIVLADMRGLGVFTPECAKLFGEIIRYGRERGGVCCLHLSDSSVARLQTARLAREVSPHDTVTINVVSLEEAERVIEERYRSLRRG
jgi:hypothetical protein